MSTGLTVLFFLMHNLTTKMDLSLIGVEVINPIDFEQFCNDVMPVFTSLFLEKATASRPRSIEQLESIPSPRLAILDVSIKILFRLKGISN